MSSFPVSQDIDANRKVIQSRDSFVTSNSITFAAGTTGSIAAHTIFTVTGDILVGSFIESTTSSITSGGAATIKLGTLSVTDFWDGPSDYTSFTTGTVMMDGGFTTGESVHFGSTTNGLTIVNGDDIIYTIAGATVTGGSMKFYLTWRPLSADGNVVAA